MNTLEGKSHPGWEGKGFSKDQFNQSSPSINFAQSSPKNPRILTAMMKDNLFNILNNGNSTVRPSVKPPIGKKLTEKTVIERNECWLKSKNAKLKQAKKLSKFKETENCTFEPKICSYRKTHKKQSRNSISE